MTPSQRVEAAGGLAPTLEAAFNAGGLHIVVVPVECSETIRVLVVVLPLGPDEAQWLTVVDKGADG